MIFASHFAFEMLNDAEKYYRENGKFSDEVLQCLHDIFGKAFLKAAEFLEAMDAVQYETPDRIRTLLKISNKYEFYFLLNDINYCYCPTFKDEVLDAKKSITCKHVLVARLAKLLGNVKIEVIPDAHFVNFFNLMTENVTS